MWFIIRMRSVGHEVDDLVFLPPVGPFPDWADAVEYLRTHGYDNEGGHDLWRSTSDQYETVELLEAVAPDA